MKRLIPLLITALTLLILPTQTFAAAGIFASGGGTKTAGQNFTVTVTASGAEFDSLQGTISVSGPVSIVSFSAGSATWLPGKTPGNGTQFVGITSAKSSLTVATITLKGTTAGSGSVSVSGVKLARSGAVVGSSGGSASFTINRAPVLPGSISVSSSTHPDQNQSYTEKKVSLEWTKPSGVTGFSYLFDQSAGTTPAAKVTSANTSVTYEDQAVGTYYFHIRGQNSDGWGATSHYKVTIKEPDPTVDETTGKPVIEAVTKLPDFAVNVQDGTVTGLKITGKGPAGFTVALTVTPTLTLPEGKTLTATVDEQGTWEVTLDYPIRSGFYALTTQGQKEKTLTPVSDPFRFELTLAEGGNIRVITDQDAFTPVPSATPSPTAPTLAVLGYAKKPYVWGIALVLLIALAVTPAWKRKRTIRK